MLSRLWFRTVSYVRGIFTDDPYQDLINSLLSELEKGADLRAAQLELQITYLRDELTKKDEAYIQLQQEFLGYAMGQGNQVPQSIPTNLPPPVEFNRAAWGSKRSRLENIARRNATVNERINNVEEDLFGPGTTDAFTGASERADSD